MSRVYPDVSVVEATLVRNTATDTNYKELAWDLLHEPKAVLNSKLLERCMDNLGLFSADCLDCLDEDEQTSIAMELKPVARKVFRKYMVEIHKSDDCKSGECMETVRCSLPKKIKAVPVETPVLETEKFATLPTAPCIPYHKLDPRDVPIFYRELLSKCIILFTGLTPEGKRQDELIKRCDHVPGTNDGLLKFLSLMNTFKDDLKTKNEQAVIEAQNNSITAQQRSRYSDTNYFIPCTVRFHNSGEAFEDSDTTELVEILNSTSIAGVKKILSFSPNAPELKQMKIVINRQVESVQDSYFLEDYYDWRCGSEANGYYDYYYNENRETKNVRPIEIDCIDTSMKRYDTVLTLARMGYFVGDSNMRKSYMLVFIKTSTGKSLQIPVKRQGIVNDVQISIQEIEGIPIDQQRLIFTGRQLDDFRCLDFYGIKEDSTLHLVLRLRGGMYHSSTLGYNIDEQTINCNHARWCLSSKTADLNTPTVRVIIHLPESIPYQVKCKVGKVRNLLRHAAFVCCEEEIIVPPNFTFAVRHKIVTDKVESTIIRRVSLDDPLDATLTYILVDAEC